jgi:SAM-dependent methyltransferase
MTQLRDEMQFRECPACGRASPHLHRLQINGCRILQCRDCGLGSAECQAGFDPAGYYTGEYFSGGQADGYSDYVATAPVLRREFARSVHFIRRFCPGGRLLELGCAYGFFLVEAARFFDVTGIELAREAAEHARSLGLNVVHGAADESSLGQIGELDVIVLFDVIEHLQEPREALALCLKKLRANGIVVITTGDFGSLLARLAGARWRLMTPPQHLWFFTRESICRMAAGLNLAVEHLDHPWKVVPLSLIFFQMRRMLGLPARPLRSASSLGVPINLFDAMRVVLRKPP